MECTGAIIQKEGSFTPQINWKDFKINQSVITNKNIIKGQA